ncbi:MAG: hypothetical protein EPN26_16635 [Rhodospirillales bacterium]|nr:MAG: hypothetical protein EPN26_16635 [Rhodospirillales bacterium]
MSILSALGLSACGDGPVTQQSYIRSSGTWGEFIYAGAEGPILLEIRGEPFKGQQPQLERAVLGALEGAHPERPTRYTLDPAQAPHANFKVTLMFDPPKTARASHLCAGEALAQQPNEPGKVNILMGFCSKGEMLAESWGWVKKVEGLDDKRLEKLIVYAVRHLFQVAK